MPMSKADIILNPVRMKIIQSLVKRPLTSQELLEWLPGIPQATLYRHLKVLSDHEVIFISNQRKVRGTIERTYAINHKLASISNEEALKLSKEEHLKYFMTFAANLIQGVEQYLNTNNFDMEKDGFGYRQIDLYLDDDEMEKFTSELSEVFNKYAQHEPKPERKKRTMATVFIPE